MLYETAQSFVDDIVLFSKTSFEHHLEVIEEFFQKMRNAGLGLRMDKCKWCFQEITFLRMICNSEYCRPDPSRFRKLEQLLKCDSKRALKSCLCYLSYHRNFIPAFSEISYPISCLLYTSPSPRD